jgi:hypothetical protein
VKIQEYFNPNPDGLYMTTVTLKSYNSI